MRDQRHFDPEVREWMDTAVTPDAALQGTLENLRILNARFGALRMARTLLAPILLRESPLRWLDLACGLGDIPAHCLEHFPGAKGRVEITAVDASEATLHFARQHGAGLPMRFVEADILHYAPDFQPDLVTCFLALHHFSTRDAGRLLELAASWGARLTVFADLERSRLAIVGIDALTTIWMRQPETQNDARLSIRRAFSFEELGDLACLSGWCGFEQRRFPMFRQAIWLGNAT